MFMFFTKSFFLMAISILSFVALFFTSKPTIIQTDLNSFTEIPLSISLIIDFQSLTFLSTVSAVSSLILMYSFLYMQNESKRSMKKFMLIMMSFIISMIVLSMSANVFWMMIGWDGLGLSSFCLIIFYQNWKSFSSGMVTFLSNRMGDILIILSMAFIIVNNSINSWTFCLESVWMYSLFSMGAYSKSAQFPYSFWLPQAMAAPTPVSALVHSSTLVTAGIYTMCRFNPIPSDNTFVQLSFIFISSITVIIAGTSSIMEFDLKKVIALSTLCHISLMMMFSIMGNILNSLFHLMMHAFFKSLLFMIAGYLIHYSMNSQDIRHIKMSVKNIKISFPFFISIMSMMGFPFMSGFYSKESLMGEVLYSTPSISMMVMFMLNSMFSCAYSSRLAKFIFCQPKLSTHSFQFEGYGYIFTISAILSSFMGGIMMSLMIPMEEETVQPPMLKLVLLVFSTLGILLGIYSHKLIQLKNLTFFISQMSEMWKSDFLYKIFQKHFFLLTFTVMWKMDEKGTSKSLFLHTTTKLINLFSTITQMFLKEPFSMIKVFHIFIISSMMMLL